MRDHPWYPSAFAALLILLIAILYFARLGSSPPYLSIEEVGTARQSLSIAATGRDLTGRWLPLFVAEPGYEAGRDPIWVYAQAALLKLAPFSEALVRTPSAIAGILNVVLMFLIGRRVFGRSSRAIVAAAVLALTPAHFMQSRIASQQIGPVLFELLWLFFFTRYLESSRPRDLFLAGASLGLGTYAYLPGAIMLPIYFAITIAALTLAGPGGATPDPAVARPWARTTAVVAAGVAVSLVPMLLWHVVHPERLRQLTDYYSQNGYNEDVGAGGAAAVYWLITRLDIWWNTLNPERLLFVGDSDYRFSTRQVGYLLLSGGVLAIAGLANVRRLRPELRVIVVAGLVFAPVPAVLAGSFEIKRWLHVVPYFALLATLGFDALAGARRPVWRAAAPLLCAAGVLQFAAFAADYHGDYRARAGYTYGGNYRGVVQELVAGTDDPACAFVDSRIVRRAQWALYTRAAGLVAYADRENVVDVERADFSPPASCRTASIAISDERTRENPAFGARLEAERWIRIPVREVDGRVVYSVYRRSSVSG